MTTKEKLEKALDALGLIETSTWSDMKSIKMFAGRIYAELTTPRTETVEVRRYEQRDSGGKTRFLSLFPINLNAHEKGRGDYVIELIGTDTRPIPEPGTWEGKVFCSHKDGGWLKGLPNEWIGKRVIVEVCE